jgi:hypothetical protein
MPSYQLPGLDLPGRPARPYRGPSVGGTLGGPVSGTGGPSISGPVGGPVTPNRSGLLGALQGGGLSPTGFANPFQPQTPRPVPTPDDLFAGGPGQYADPTRVGTRADRFGDLYGGNLLPPGNADPFRDGGVIAPATGPSGGFTTPFTTAPGSMIQPRVKNLPNYTPPDPSVTSGPLSPFQRPPGNGFTGPFVTGPGSMIQPGAPAQQPRMPGSSSIWATGWNPGQGTATPTFRTGGTGGGR